MLIRRIIGLALFIAIIIGLGTIVPRPFFTQKMALNSASQASQSMANSQDIFVISSDIHTDLVFRLTPQLADRFAFMAADGLNPAQSGAEYLIIGWGGRSFYLQTPSWADLKPMPVIKALTIDRSVMHVELTGPLDLNHPSVLPITLDQISYDNLLRAVLADFHVEPNASPKVIFGAQYGPYDLFYEAKGWFNALVGCNIWTAHMLRQAGLRTGWWTPLPKLLIVSLKQHNDAARFGIK